jgi:transcriptional regulator with XRE-family HTH domain
MTDEPGIGLVIRRARERKRMTQEELAAAVGVDRSAVSNWENDRHFPLRVAGAIEVVLDITIPAQQPSTAAPDDEPAKVPAA